MNPESNFITSLLNIDPSNIESFTAHTDIETAICCQQESSLLTLEKVVNENRPL